MTKSLVLTVLPSALRDPSGEIRESFRDVLAIAQRAERAGADGFFLADSLAFDVSFSRHNRFEPLTLAAGVLAHTERISVIATLSTTFTHPFHIARYLSSLSYIGNGRIGANLVTSFDGEKNFGLTELPDPAERYARADDFIDVIQQLWGSWGPYSDAWANINFSSEHFTVEGPLSIKPYPGKLLVGQSGSSPPGIDLAARVGDFVFTAAQVDHVLRHYTEALTKRCTDLRMDGKRPTILSGLAPIIGETPEQAREHERVIMGALSFEVQLDRLEEVLGDIDLSDVDPGDTFPRERLLPIEMVGRRQGRAASIYGLIEKNDLSLAEVVRSQNKSNGHRTVVGTADGVADEIVRIANTGLTDGFIILLPKYTELADKVFDELFPRLEHRGYLVPAGDAESTRSRFLPRS